MSRWNGFLNDLEMVLKPENKRVTIDPGAGFCSGVEKAISVAEERLKDGERIYGLGQMVHNEHEVHRLKHLGLETIEVKDFSRIGPARVILRAHGEPPSTYSEAEKAGIDLIDATCPIVKNLQMRVRRTFEEMEASKEQLVIFGKEDHPETIGLVGQTGGKALVVSDPNDFDHLDSSKGIHLFSQTTMDPDAFNRLEANLRRAFEVSDATPVIAECSICNQMKRRKPDLARFAASNDVIIFISGRHSSNGEMLFRFCKGVNRRTHWISSTDEITKAWFDGAETIGISGATSTSFGQLDDARTFVLGLIRG
jgi:4-hydroxy-3-methylbut-2-enyl diphosphate reductase